MYAFGSAEKAQKESNKIIFTQYLKLYIIDLTTAFVRRFLI